MLSPKVYLASLVEAGYLDQIAADRLELESLQTGKEIETLVLSYNLAPFRTFIHGKIFPCELLDRMYNFKY
jgi:hypothetical protein